jgi:hypothetical protein
MQQLKNRPIENAASVIANIKSGDHIFIHGAAATPNNRIQMLLERAYVIFRFRI